MHTCFGEQVCVCLIFRKILGLEEKFPKTTTSPLRSAEVRGRGWVGKRSADMSSKSFFTASSTSPGRLKMSKTNCILHTKCINTRTLRSLRTFGLSAIICQWSFCAKRNSTELLKHVENSCKF